MPQQFTSEPHLTATCVSKSDLICDQNWNESATSSSRLLYHSA